jgi:CRP-like cAMP-binding protein
MMAKRDLAPNAADEGPQLDGRGNRLLEALPARERDRLSGMFEIEDWAMKERLMEAGERIHSVYFPLTAVVSLLTTLDEGEGVEIATVGNEGMIGVPVFLGAETLGTRDLVQTQVPGTALRADAAAFLREAQDGSAFRGIVQRYVQAYLRQVSQQVACNGLHPVVERCARWILLTHDRVGADEFPLTQEFLSQMLGVRRATVTVAAGTLQSARFVRFDRGRIRILDRKGLEGSACECYAVIRNEFDRLLGPRNR